MQYDTIPEPKLRSLGSKPHRFFSYPAASLPLSLVASHSLFAQAIYGSLAGTITDTTGAVIPNATVTITDVNKGTRGTVTSNGAGNYIVDTNVDNAIYNSGSPYMRQLQFGACFTF